MTPQEILDYAIIVVRILACVPIGIFFYDYVWSKPQPNGVLRKVRQIVFYTLLTSSLIVLNLVSLRGQRILGVETASMVNDLISFSLSVFWLLSNWYAYAIVKEIHNAPPQ